MLRRLWIVGLILAHEPLRAECYGSRAIQMEVLAQVEREDPVFDRHLFHMREGFLFSRCRIGDCSDFSSLKRIVRPQSSCDIASDQIKSIKTSKRPVWRLGASCFHDLPKKGTMFFHRDRQELTLLDRATFEKEILDEAATKVLIERLRAAQLDLQVTDESLKIEGPTRLVESIHDPNFPKAVIHKFLVTMPVKIPNNDWQSPAVLIKADVPVYVLQWGDAFQAFAHGNINHCNPYYSSFDSSYKGPRTVTFGAIEFHALRDLDQDGFPDVLSFNAGGEVTLRMDKNFRFTYGPFQNF